jgi:hypothetical protein
MLPGLPQVYRDVFTAARRGSQSAARDRSLLVAELFDTLPVALLEGASAPVAAAALPSPIGTRRASA